MFLALLVAAAAVVLTRYSVNGSGLTQKRSVSGVSSIQVLVDTRYSSLARVAIPTTASSVTQRTPLYADYAASPPLQKAIAARARVAPAQLLITSDTTETEAATGASQSTSYNIAPAPSAPYKIVLQANDTVPVITISATAPSAVTAASLVTSAVYVLQSKVTRLERSESVKGSNRMVLRSLGSATGATIATTPSLSKSILVGLVVVIVLVVVVLLLDGVRRRGRDSQEVSSTA